MKANQNAELFSRDRSTTSNGGNQKNLITILKLVLHTAQESDVLVIDIDIEETLWSSIRPAKGWFDPGELLLEAIEQIGQMVCRAFDRFLPISIPTQGRGDPNVDGHAVPPGKIHGKSKVEKQKARVRKQRQRSNTCTRTIVRRLIPIFDF
jgi:hypothetical protein